MIYLGNAGWNAFELSNILYASNGRHALDYIELLKRWSVRKL